MKGKQHDSFNTWTSWVMSMKNKKNIIALLSDKIFKR